MACDVASSPKALAEWRDIMCGGVGISQRVVLVVAGVVVRVGTTVWLGMSELRQSLIDDRKEAIKNLVQVAGHVLEIWYAKEKSGALSRDAAQKGAVEELSKLRFADGNYFFAQNFEGVTVLHVDPALQGKNRIDIVDPDGVRTVVRQIEIAKSGGGFFSYRASRTGGTAAVAGAGISPKLAYISGFDPWQWAFGSGIYIDDVDAIYYRIMWQFAGFAGVLMLIASFVVYFVPPTITRPLAEITDRMGELAGGNLAIQLPF